MAAEYEVRTPDGKWHPSGLFGCPRQTIYRFRGTEETEPPDERIKRVFRVGHLLHDFIQGSVAAHPEVIKAYAEVPINHPELDIVGAADQLLLLQGDRWELEEYKSINSMSFRFKDLPKPDHVGQNASYMFVLREFGAPEVGIPPLGDALTRGRITYVSKDDLKVEEHLIFWSPAKEAEIRKRVAYLEQYRSTGLPPRLAMQPDKKTGEPKRHYLCGYCPFATRCWDQDPEEE